MLGLRVRAMFICASFWVQPAFSAVVDSLSAEIDPLKANWLCNQKFGYGSGQCFAYPKKHGVTIYETPDIAPSILEFRAFGWLVYLIDSAIDIGDKEWVRTYTTLKTPVKGRTKHIGYARRADLVLVSDFRLVIGCWPVKRFVNQQYKKGEEYGDFVPPPPILEMTIDGKANGWYEKKAKEPAKYGTQRVYYADGIFTIADSEYSDYDYYPYGTLDLQKREIKGGGYLLHTDVEWYPAEKLKECKNVPLVSDEGIPSGRKNLSYQR